MTEWRKVKLGELYEVHNGLSKGRQFFGSGYPFLSFSTVFNHWFLPEQLDSLVQSTEKERIACSIKRGDVFITRTSETMDELGMSSVALKDYPNATYNGFTKRLRPITDQVLPEFIGYYLRSRKFRAKFMAFSSMTTRASLANDDLLSMEVEVPEKSVQHRIAEVLSRYDALIENYQRQIKLLEEAAQRLYKEWFVDLRFPGHQSTPIINNLPQSWQKKTVEECLIFHGNGGWGKDSPTGKYEHPGKVIRGTDIEDIKTGRYNDLPLRFHTDNDMKKRTLKKDDLVFELSNGNINNIGRCLLIDEIILKNTGDNTICASFCKLLRPIDRFHALMLYWEIQDMQTSGRMLPLKKQGANGINNFDFDGFLSHVLLIPSDESLISPLEVITKNIGRTQGEIALLSEARDRLLPKLMNGEIEV